VHETAVIILPERKSAILLSSEFDAEYLFLPTKTKLAKAWSVKNWC